MRTRHWLVAAAVVPALSLAPLAQTAHADAPSHAARAQGGDRALELFEESATAYRDGRFQDAVDLLVEARRMKAEPVLLYNLGRAYEALGNPTLAADAYAAYVKEEPRAADRRAIEARIATLRTQAIQLDMARQPPPADPKPMPERPAEGAPDPPRVVVPWVVTAVGVVGIGVGVGLGLSANAHHRDAVEAPDQVSAQSDQDRARSLATGSTIAFVAGAVVAAAGITWLTVHFASGPVRVSGGLERLGVEGTF